MAPYRHHINTHHRARRARKVKKIANLAFLLVMLAGVGIGIDWMLGKIRAEKTVVSVESSATVQSARINVFQSPYFRFQAGAQWREVTDELNLKPSAMSGNQYLYRSFEKNFIEHELWITVNRSAEYVLERHNIPTRVLPVVTNEDGTISLDGEVSEPCVKSLPKDDQNLSPHVMKHEGVTLFCDPNNDEFYHVALGIKGGTERIPFNSEDESYVITITYRNITATPEPSQLLDIINSFRLL